MEKYGSSYGKFTAYSEAVIQGEKYRITVLTASLLRLEFSEAGEFEDRITQVVINREFPVIPFVVEEQRERLQITTEYLHLSYEKEKPFKDNIAIKVVLDTETQAVSRWSFDEAAETLKGTARTLDNADGSIPLEEGLNSQNGFALLNDSCSMVIMEDGWVDSRKGNGIDLYFFGYGHRYRECIRDFYKLCGKTPLLPRWVFGNWWSRYHKYSEEEYKQLMLRFQVEKLPFSVAVIDMDWHLTDIPPIYGTGWTGYTWNRELFPNPAEFMEWLHGQGMRVTLNVHPADGIRAHEEQYEKMAGAAGINPAGGQPVEFDIGNADFMKAYFEIIHHPMEEEGVDFWWIDWQQGTKTSIPGMDPLWMLNHYHYLDSKRNGKRGLTFSRYAGIGSHRYPIGFSGDTIISWESLQFQPFFTAAASNVGYGWWSHDIGGHMLGARDDELTVRWIQLGVFSPINRLHSSDNPFSGKEPWNYNKRAELIIGDWLRLRHRLIPYLYTMNRYASRDGRPLICPLYWEEADCAEAYEFPNEYYFGTELLAAPVTGRMDREADLARVNAWLPEGIWFDCQSGRMYNGGRRMELYRTLEEFPVFARAGALLVQSAEESNLTHNPGTFDVDIYPGSDGAFTLWEDEGENAEDEDSRWCATVMTFRCGQGAELIIGKAQGNLSAIPHLRNWKLHFRNINQSSVEIIIDGSGINGDISYEENKKTLTVALKNISVKSSVKVCLAEYAGCQNIDRIHQTFTLLNRAQTGYEQKEKILKLLDSPRETVVTALRTMELNPYLEGALLEILFSA